MALIKNKKRLALKIVGGIVLCGLLLALWAFVIEPNRLTVNEVQLPLRNWPASLDNLRVVAISDLHVGSPFIDLEKVQKIVRTTNDLHPDVVVLLGDFVRGGMRGGHFIEPEPIAEQLKGLHARLGVYAVLGNHDWWYDGARVTRALQSAGITVLENDVARVEQNGQSLWLLGVPDFWTREQDITGALKKVTDDGPIIALTHNPDIFPDIPAKIVLTLAGHTHGGQLMLGDSLGFGPLMYRYWSGLYRKPGPGGAALVVSNGVGNWFPLRTWAPAEIIDLTLRSPA